MNKRQMLGSGGGGHAEKGEEVKKGGVRRCEDRAQCWCWTVPSNSRVH